MDSKFYYFFNVACIKTHQSQIIVGNDYRINYIDANKTIEAYLEKLSIKYDLVKFFFESGQEKIILSLRVFSSDIVEWEILDA